MLWPQNTHMINSRFMWFCIWTPWIQQTLLTRKALFLWVSFCCDVIFRLVIRMKNVFPSSACPVMSRFQRQALSSASSFWGDLFLNSQCFDQENTHDKLLFKWFCKWTHWMHQTLLTRKALFLWVSFCCFVINGLVIRMKNVFPSSACPVMNRFQRRALSSASSFWGDMLLDLQCFDQKNTHDKLRFKWFCKWTLWMQQTLLARKALTFWVSRGCDVMTRSSFKWKTSFCCRHPRLQIVYKGKL